MAQEEEIVTRLIKLRGQLTELLTANSESEHDKRKENVGQLEEIGQEIRSILKALRAEESLRTKRGKNKITGKKKRELDSLIAWAQNLQRLDRDLRRINLVPNNLEVFAELLKETRQMDREEKEAHLERLEILATGKQTKTYSEIGPRYDPAETEPRPVFAATGYIILGLALAVRYINRRKLNQRGRKT